MKKTVESLEPRSLREVREWKEARYSEVAGLPLRDAIRNRLRDASARAEEAGFPSAQGVPHLVAESQSRYRRREN